jgi:signal transduction histidine kinase
MVYAVVTLVGTGISLVLAIVAWRARPKPGATPLAILTLAIAQWNLSMFFAVLLRDVGASTAWTKFHHLGLTIVVPALLVLVLEYAGRDDLVTRRTIGLLMIEPIVHNVLIWTNDAHGLAIEYAPTGMQAARSAPWWELSVPWVTRVDQGAWFWMNSTYQWGLAFVCLGIVTWLAVRQRDRYRAQLAVLGVAILVALGGNLVDNLLNPSIRLTEPGFVVSELLLTIAVVEFDLVDLTPVARATVLAELSGGVLVLDDEDRITDINPRGRELLRVAPETQVLGEHAQGVLSAVPGVYERYEDVHDSEGTVPVDVDGERRYYQVRVSSVTDGRDRYLGRVFLINDVTSERERERELQRQNEQLDRFAGVVSHDLRNPLQVASSHVALAKETPDDEEHLRTINRNLTRMETIVEDVLTLARQGQTIEDTEPVSLPAVAERAWDGVDTAAATFENDLDGAVLADEGRLRQIFENLFRNAIEHGGPDVTVCVGEILDAASGLDPQERGFFIGDDGPGIPEAERDQVFEPGHTQREDGTGLGLAISQSIVEAHGWSISVTESATGGARFEITGVERPTGQSA